MAIFTRKVKTIDVNGNALFGQEFPVNLPRQHFYQRLALHVVLGALTGGTSPAYITGAANKLVKNLRLDIGGQLTVRNLSFEDLRRLNLLTYKDQVPAAGYAYMDLGLLPSFLFTSLTLYVQFETLANLTTGAPTAAAGTELRIRARETINEGQSPAATPLVVHKTMTRDLNSVSGDQAIDIRDGNIIQAILVMPTTTAAPTGSTTLINTLSVVQDGVKSIRAADPYLDLQEDVRADFELDGAPTDFAVLNFDVYGNGTEALATKAMDTLELIPNVNSEAGGKVRLLIVELQAPAKA